eukprot:Pgem_evm1s1771
MTEFLAGFKRVLYNPYFKRVLYNPYMKTFILFPLFFNLIFYVCGYTDHSIRMIREYSCPYNEMNISDNSFRVLDCSLDPSGCADIKEIHNHYLAEVYKNCSNVPGHCYISFELDKIKACS